MLGPGQKRLNHANKDVETSCSARVIKKTHALCQQPQRTDSSHSHLRKGANGTLLDELSLSPAVCLRLAVRTVQSYQCTGNAVDEFGHHGLSYIRSSGLIFRHPAFNRIISIGSSALRQLQSSSLLPSSAMKARALICITVGPWKLGRQLV